MREAMGNVLTINVIVGKMKLATALETIDNGSLIVEARVMRGKLPLHETIESRVRGINV